MSREQFEAWIADTTNSDLHRSIMLDKRENGSYRHLATHNKWEAWQEANKHVEAKCAALAAENAALKSAIPESKDVDDDNDSMDDVSLAEDFGFNVAVSLMKIRMSETPATDAFLAEVRAQGADECVRQLVISNDDDFSDAPNVCAMVAYQLRHEAAQ